MTSLLTKFLRWFQAEPDPIEGAANGPVPEQPESSSHDGFSDLADKAAAQISSPITQKFDWVVLQAMPATGKVLAVAEVALENADGSLTVGTCATKIVSASGAVIHPHQIVSKCDHPGCGQVEATLLRCDVCGAVRCYLHCRQMTVQGKERILCEEHLRETLNDWDSWAEYDLARGFIQRPPSRPPRPLAVKQPHTTSSLNGTIPQRHTKQAPAEPNTRPAH